MKCDYGEVSVSRTAKNPGKRFWGCPNYKDPSRNCRYFKWVLETPSCDVEEDGKKTIKQQDQGQDQLVDMLKIIVALLICIVVLLIVVLMKM